MGGFVPADVTPLTAGIASACFHTGYIHHGLPEVWATAISAGRQSAAASATTVRPAWSGVRRSIRIVLKPFILFPIGIRAEDGAGPAKPEAGNAYVAYATDLTRWVCIKNRDNPQKSGSGQSV